MNWKFILRWPKRIPNRAEKTRHETSECSASNLAGAVAHSLRIASLSAAALLLLLILAVSNPAQTTRQGPASECASCHASASLNQSQTPMGRALQLAGKNPTLLSHPKLTFQKWGFTYLVETKGTESTYSVTDGTRTISLPIHWTFGKGAQTWVFERDGVYYESLVSYYPSIDGLAVTTGDEGLLPKTLDEAVGRKLGNMEVKDCFRCHSTRSVARGQLDLNSLEEGVTCEHCHQGSNAHATGGFQGKFAETDRKSTRLN